jgi:hypothetical protein
MKTIYLDQLHWIEISKAIHGRPVRPGTAEALEHIRRRAAGGDLLFPLSLAHYFETLKQVAPDRRRRLSIVMRELSGGNTLANPTTIVKHEIRCALISKLGLNVPSPPLKLLGRGIEHALGRNFNTRLEWPHPEQVTDEVRQKVETDVVELLETTFLSGVLHIGEEPLHFPQMALDPDKKFLGHLTQWRGSGATMSAAELRRKVCAFTLSDIMEPISVVLAELGVTMQCFAELGETGWCDLLDMMPSRRADMHLHTQWAKNASLNPKLSDLNDWTYLGIAVCYCDLVVTENQMNALFQRSTEFGSKSTARLQDLLAL